MALDGYWGFESKLVEGTLVDSIATTTGYDKGTVGACPRQRRPVGEIRFRREKYEAAKGSRRA